MALIFLELILPRPLLQEPYARNPSPNPSLHPNPSHHPNQEPYARNPNPKPHLNPHPNPNTSPNPNKSHHLNQEPYARVLSRSPNDPEAFLRWLAQPSGALALPAPVEA